MLKSTNFRTATGSDRDGIHAVHNAAFGRSDEADLVDRLVEAAVVLVSIVAERESEIVGHVLFTRVTIETDKQTLPAVSLAPVGVVPKCQRAGIGSELIRRGLDLSRERGEKIVIVLGDPQYYSRFGFSATLGRQLRSPFSDHGDAWMALELEPDALKGVSGFVRYAKPFLR